MGGRAGRKPSMGLFPNLGLMIGISEVEETPSID